MGTCPACDLTSTSSLYLHPYYAPGPFLHYTQPNVSENANHFCISPLFKTLRLCPLSYGSKCLTRYICLLQQSLGLFLGLTFIAYFLAVVVFRLVLLLYYVSYVWFCNQANRASTTCHLDTRPNN